MFKLYNSQEQITSELSKFLQDVVPNISKPHFKIIPDIIFGMIKSESIVTTDIIKKLSYHFSCW